MALCLTTHISVRSHNIRDGGFPPKSATLNIRDRSKKAKGNEYVETQTSPVDGFPKIELSNETLQMNIRDGGSKYN